MTRAGRRTFAYGGTVLRAAAAVVGPKEGQGPLGADFDSVLPDDLLGMDSWEQAESEMLRRAVELCASKAGMTVMAVDLMLAGDLQDQITASGFAARALGIPFFGLYGACSTFVQALVLGGALVDGGLADTAVFVRGVQPFLRGGGQYRFPLELGNQRPPSAQWTATAAGAALVARGEAAFAASPTAPWAASWTFRSRTPTIWRGDGPRRGRHADRPPPGHRAVARGFRSHRHGDLGIIGRELLMD